LPSRSPSWRVAPLSMPKWPSTTARSERSTTQLQSTSPSNVEIASVAAALVALPQPFVTIQWNALPEACASAIARVSVTAPETVPTAEIPAVVNPLPRPAPARPPPQLIRERPAARRDRHGEGGGAGRTNRRRHGLRGQRRAARRPNVQNRGNRDSIGRM